MEPLANLRQLASLSLDDVACSQQGWALLAQLPSLRSVRLGALCIGQAQPAAAQVLEVTGNLDLALPGEAGSWASWGPALPLAAKPQTRAR
jgi:hypothetical protein